MIKEQLSVVTHNIVGGAIGGLVGFFAAKKLGLSHVWALVGVAVVGVIAGANVQSHIKAHKGTPTAETVKK